MARLPSVTDLVSWIKGLERRVRILETAPRLGNASIGSGNLRIYGDNGLIIEGVGRVLFSNGGSLLMLDQQGREYFYAGGFSNVGFGVTLTRINGTQALVFGDDNDEAEDVQHIRLQDRNGLPLASEDPGGGGLISWPLVPLTTYSADYRQWAGTTSGTFTELKGARHFRHSPRVQVRVRHTTDVSGTAGELRVLVNGAQIGAVVPVSFSISSTDLVGTIPESVGWGQSVNVSVEARRTAGSGEVRAEIEFCTHRES